MIPDHGDPDRWASSSKPSRKRSREDDSELASVQADLTRLKRILRAAAVREFQTKQPFFNCDTTPDTLRALGFDVRCSVVIDDQTYHLAAPATSDA